MEGQYDITLHHKFLSINCSQYSSAVDTEAGETNAGVRGIESLQADGRCSEVPARPSYFA